MTWQEEKGMKRTVDKDGTVRYDGYVAIRESIDNMIKQEIKKKLQHNS
jgi:hypothetical protein